MTTEMLIIAAVRIVGSLPVLRWPFWGGVFAILVDQNDLFLMNLLHLGGVEDYQSFDKYLDQVYLGLFLVVAWRWPGIERNVAAGLYAYRLAGFVVFEVTQSRGLLLFFPNLFEFWFLFIAARRHFGLESRLPLAPKLDGAWNVALVSALGGLIALKLFQEYAIHQARWLDGFTATEAVEAIWHFLTPF
jgi:hypothetical protein